MKTYNPIRSRKTATCRRCMSRLPCSHFCQVDRDTSRMAAAAACVRPAALRRSSATVGGAVGFGPGWLGIDGNAALSAGVRGKPGQYIRWSGCIAAAVLGCASGDGAGFFKVARPRLPSTASNNAAKGSQVFNSSSIACVVVNFSFGQIGHDISLIGCGGLGVAGHAKRQIFECFISIFWCHRDHVFRTNAAICIPCVNYTICIRWNSECRSIGDCVEVCHFISLAPVPEARRSAILLPMDRLYRTLCDLQAIKPAFINYFIRTNPNMTHKFDIDPITTAQPEGKNKCLWFFI